jgi:hypothetical protein
MIRKILVVCFGLAAAFAVVLALTPNGPSVPASAADEFGKIPAFLATSSGDGCLSIDPMTPNGEHSPGCAGGSCRLP